MEPCRCDNIYLRNDNINTQIRVVNICVKESELDIEEIQK